MHALGYYSGAQRTLDGDLCIMFSVDDSPEVLEQLEKLADKQLTLDVKRYSEKRSLNANAYLWVLCDKIAKYLGSDKDTIYLLQIGKYGVFHTVEVIEPAVKYLEPLYRVVQVDHYYSKPMIDAEGAEYIATFAEAKCYIGSSQYDSTQMAHLLNGTVNDAHDLGIETWTREEIDNLINRWSGHDNY